MTDFQFKVQCALYPNGIKHPNQAEPDALINESGWMPIESAPHGVNILVFVPEFADNGEDNSFMASGYCEDDGRFIPHEGEGDYEPTHWLPLPQPPEVKE